MNKRIEQMKENLQQLNQAGVRKTFYYRFIAEAIRQHQGEPVQIIRAKAIENILLKVPITIEDPELLVGSMTGLCPVFDEHAIFDERINQADEIVSEYLEKKRMDDTINAGKQYSEDDVRTFEDDFTNKKSRWALMSRVHHDSNITYEELQRLISVMEEKYVRPNGPIDKYEIGRELERAFKFDYKEDKELVTSLPWFVANHLSLDYNAVLSVGLSAFTENLQSLRRHNSNDDEKKEYYDAALIVTGAMKQFMLRCEAYLNRRVESEALTDVRKVELTNLAVVCKKLSTEKPETFYESIQLLWSLHLIAQFCGASAMSFARIDQYLLPFYQQGITDEDCSTEFMEEILSNLWVKINEPKMRTVQSLTLGGITRSGENAFNDLSRFCMKTLTELKLPYPNVGLRINQKNPADIYDYAVASYRNGTGNPMLLNDHIWIENMLSLGYPVEDANDYYNMGCVEIMIPNKLPNWGVTEAIAFPMVLENTFNKIGRHQLSISTFDEFMQLYFDEMKQAIQRDVQEALAKKTSQDGKCFDPYASLLIDSCIEQGKDMFQGGVEYPTHWSIYAYGLGTLADSLQVVKSAVFEDRLVTLDKMSEILQKNFEGYEELREIFQKDYAKFGNNMAAVDQLADQVLSEFNKEIFSLNKGLHEDKFVTTLFGYFFHIYHGEITGATPDGRLKGEPFSDSMGPSQGKDIEGPTSLLNSTLLLDNQHITGGYALNLKINPQFLKEDQGTEALKYLLMTYMSEGGPQVQVYTSSVEDLKDAQKYPEKHTDLIVRVGGYCEYFVNLDRALQNEIITRTLHEC
ncbi:pyruvate formate lyase family protein [Enterococcus sp. AZ128]|uniref:pyruvate formate lyase family protein n=2 Tax=Enterococcus TaxID=1350 RepID=UPI003F683965